VRRQGRVGCSSAACTRPHSNAIPGTGASFVLWLGLWGLLETHPIRVGRPCPVHSRAALQSTAPAVLRDMSSSASDVFTHGTRAALAGATVVALAKSGTSPSGKAPSASCGPAAGHLPVGALVVVLATLRDLYVLQVFSSADGRCLVPLESHNGVGRRFQLPDGSWAAVKAWAARHTRPLRLSISRAGHLVGPLVGGAAYDGVQTQLTSNTAWLDDPAYAPVYAAVWQLKRIVMGPRLVAAAARGGGGGNNVKGTEPTWSQLEGMQAYGGGCCFARAKFGRVSWPLAGRHLARRCDALLSTMMSSVYEMCLCWTCHRRLPLMCACGSLC